MKLYRLALLSWVTIAIPLTLSASGPNPPASPPYEWPRISPEALKWSREKRLQAVGREINLYAKRVGSCLYKKDAVGEAARRWIDRERQLKIDRTRTSGSPLEFCTTVKREYVDKKLTNSKRDPSPFIQYGNCGEGAEVGACIAYNFGFSMNEILICKSNLNDASIRHEWTLVPERAGGSSYCLVDRDNSFRCGVTISGQKTHFGYVDVTSSIPGKHVFDFSDATCMNLDYFAETFGPVTQ